MMTALSGGAPEQAPRWDLVDTESCGSGIRFLAPSLFFWGYVGIYRGKKYVGGASVGPRGWGRTWGCRARPPTSCPPRSFLGVGSKSPVSYSGRKSRSKKVFSVWTPFDIPFLQNTKIGKKNSNSWLGLRLIG